MFVSPVLEKKLKNISLKGRQLIILFRAPTCLGPALFRRSACDAANEIPKLKLFGS